MSPRKRSARRRGAITKLQNGRFQARVRTPADAITGKRGSAAKNFDTKPEAEQWLAEELARLDRGERVGSGSRETLEAFLRDFYANVRKTTRGDGVLSPATCQADLEMLEHYLFKRAPGLSGTSLSKLTTAPLREFFKDLSGAGLSAATVSRVHRTLRARLAYAMAEGMIRFNPMADARIPVAGKKKKQRAILSGAQAAALFAVCPESRIGPFVATLLMTGMRPGEAAGLTWDDVDFERKVIHVRRALVRLAPDRDAGTPGSWSLSTTKTGTERFVPIVDSLVPVLRRHRSEQLETRLAAGSEYAAFDLVFATTFGQPYHLDSMASKYLKPLLRRAALHLANVQPLELPAATRAQSYKDALAARESQEHDAVKATAFPLGVGWYSLRHSFATRLDKLGKSTKDISELLGHSNVTTTLTSYIHGSDESRRDTVNALEEVIAPRGRLGIA
ncbi:MAG: tyrosine-type recombinase/integrase [Gemmatimonas sp.]